MIVYKTNIKEIPKNCKDCACSWCHLPFKQNKYEPTIKKEYEKKRHKDCPLEIVDEMSVLCLEDKENERE